MNRKHLKLIKTLRSSISLSLRGVELVTRKVKSGCLSEIEPDMWRKKDGGLVFQNRPVSIIFKKYVLRFILTLKNLF